MGIARGDLVGHGARRAGVLGLRGGISMWTARRVLSFMLKGFCCLVAGLRWGRWSFGGGHPPRNSLRSFAPSSLCERGDSV